MAKKEVKKEETLLGNKILTCLYVIILLLVLNTGLLLINGMTNNGSSEESETEEEYDVSMFNDVTPSEFMELLDSDEPQVVYVGRATCGYCVKFLPTMQEAQKELGFTTQYLDVSAFDESDDDYQTMVDTINAMADYFNEKNGMEGENAYTNIYGYTPMVLVLKDGKIQDVWIGYNEYDAYKSFLESNEI